MFHYNIATHIDILCRYKRVEERDTAEDMEKLLFYFILTGAQSDIF